MNKNIDIDDAKVVSDDDAKVMNREYNDAIRQNMLVKMAGMLSYANKRNHHICILNYDDVARAYFLERDILVSLNFLHGKARLTSTKCTIKNIIKIKEKVASRLLSLYMSGKHHSLAYAPNIVDRPTYNALYQEINYMQCELLARIENIPGIYAIVSMEHTATLMLHSIRP